MLDEENMEKIKRRVMRYAEEGTTIKQKGEKFVSFFENNAKNSLDAAKLLFEASVSEKLKELTGFHGFNGFLWVINASYYSMFYMARALLENEGIRIKTELSIHSVTFDALVYYFYLTGRLKKRLIEDIAEAKEEASAILGEEKARGMIEDYFYERRKRAKFTYEMGLVAMKDKAKTSLERAKRFNEEARKVIMR